MTFSGIANFICDLELRLEWMDSGKKTMIRQLLVLVVLMFMSIVVESPVGFLSGVKGTEGHPLRLCQ